MERIKLGEISELVILDGFAYKFDRKLKDKGRESWICVLQKLQNCRGRIHTAPGETPILKTDHFHTPWQDRTDEATMLAQRLNDIQLSNENDIVKAEPTTGTEQGQRELDNEAAAASGPVDQLEGDVLEAAAASGPVDQLEGDVLEAAAASGPVDQDKFTKFGQLMTAYLKDMDPDQAMQAQRMMFDVAFKGMQGILSSNSQVI